MGTELIELDSLAQAEPEPAEGSLTWRASLNLLQSVLDYSAKLGVGLVVVPILVSGLGRTVFGVWEMLGRLMGYLESTDGRPTQALRLVISNLQSQRDPHGKRRWIGAALTVWLCFLPLWIASGVLLVRLAPAVTKVDAGFVGTVRAACVIMMVGVLLAALASLPESVLRGMNLGYKRMGLQASLSLAGGAMAAGAVAAGAGLVGVASAGLALTALTGVCFLLLARSQISWFGIERPHRSEVQSLLHMSLWIAAGDAVAKLLLASDVLVLGLVLSAGTVTTYVLTGYAALLSVNLHSLVADSVIPGLAGIIGQRNYGRAVLLRRELLALTAIFMTAAGAAILMWNRSFVHLWVGGDNYAGSWTNLLLVLVAVQTSFIRCDSYILDAALQPGRRVQVSAAAAVVAVVLSLLLTRYAGMIGLCVGVLAGRSIQTFWYPALVRRSLGDSTDRWLLRPLSTMALLFAAAAYLAPRVRVEHWAAWAVGVLLSAVGSSGILLLWGLPADLRGAIQVRVVELAGKLGVRAVGRQR
jgi:O-antigen/teichoic acid export membrane protein